MATMYDYYRPHSVTLMEKDARDDNNPGGGGEAFGGSSGKLVPVQPCIVLDARSLKGNGTTRIALRDSLHGKEVDNYVPGFDLSKSSGDVLRSMWSEIVDLRDLVKELESANHELRQRRPIRHRNKENNSNRRRRNLTYNDDDDDDDIDPDIAEKYEILEKKLSRQALEILEYRDRVDYLQKELFKKNSEPKEPSPKPNQMTRNDTEFQLRLRDKETKIRELEIACRKQETVIEQMEKLLEKKNSDLYQRRTHDMLAEENRRLRKQIEKMTEEEEEIERIREQMREKIQDRTRAGSREERIKSLEKKISDNARKWSQEKTDLLLRLQEAELGLKPRPSIDKSTNWPSTTLSRGNTDGLSRTKASTRRPRQN